ncbi:MAG TPA: helix-turn-helix transcriptional regulator [Thermoanaerobaculia bacterium]
MFRRATLIRTPIVEIVRADHLPGALRHGTEEEREGAHAVTLVEAGEFGIGAGNRDWLLGERSVMISRPGALYRYTHRPGAAPDVCLNVRFANGFDEVCERELSAAGIVPRATNRTAFLRWRLTALLARGDAMAVDAWSAELLAALRDANDDRIYRPSQLRWYAERVEAARATLEQRYAEPHTLASIAAAVAISPFQFARVFRQLTGRPPHQYLMSVRLDAARHMLRGGASVTDACFDSGFSSLSHFIHVFKQRFGHTPSMCGQRRHGRRTPH